MRDSGSFSFQKEKGFWSYSKGQEVRPEEKGAKNSQMNKALTVGKPERVLWMFCLPLFGSIIFQQRYNIADSLVAGKFIGGNALAVAGSAMGVGNICTLPYKQGKLSYQ